MQTIIKLFYRMASESNKYISNEDQMKVNLQSFNIQSNIENINKLSSISSHKLHMNNTLPHIQPPPHQTFYIAARSNKVIPKMFVKNNNRKKRNFYNDLIKKRNWTFKKFKKSFNNMEKPQTPHNTTQFIVNTVHYPTDPYVYDFDNKRFENNIKNHSILGSMMSTIIL